MQVAEHHGTSVGASERSALLAFLGPPPLIEGEGCGRASPGG